eukprot:jgi/Chrzof1/7564/Cz02g28170.t1
MTDVPHVVRHAGHSIGQYNLTNCLIAFSSLFGQNMRTHVCTAQYIAREISRQYLYSICVIVLFNTNSVQPSIVHTHSSDRFCIAKVTMSTARKRTKLNDSTLQVAKRICTADDACQP